MLREGCPSASSVSEGKRGSGGGIWRLVVVVALRERLMVVVWKSGLVVEVVGYLELGCFCSGFLGLGLVVVSITTSLMF